MNVEWRDFLKQTGADWNDDLAMRFGQSNAESSATLKSNVCCDLSHLGLIVVHGPDTERFLQGQLTCDVRQVTMQYIRTGAHCNPKGRVLACFRLFRREDAYYLELPKVMVNATLGRLRKYLLRAKAVLEDASDALARFGVAGPNAADLVGSVLGTVPETVNGVITVDNMTAIRLPGLRSRFELHGAARELGVVRNALAPNLALVESESWRLLDILAGIPTIYPETAEAFVPQMINLQQLDGVSFQKGCYTGQEIVARTHYLGKLKRRMYLARVDSPALPRPGDLLFSPQSDASQSAGQLADACCHPDGGYAVLAVALIECAEQGTLHLGDANGPLLHLEALPYGF